MEVILAGLFDPVLINSDGDYAPAVFALGHPSYEELREQARAMLAHDQQEVAVRVRVESPVYWYSDPWHAQAEGYAWFVHDDPILAGENAAEAEAEGFPEMVPFEVPGRKVTMVRPAQ